MGVTKEGRDIQPKLDANHSSSAGKSESGHKMSERDSVGTQAGVAAEGAHYGKARRQTQTEQKYR